MENKVLKKYLITTFLISWITWGILYLLVSNNILTFSSLLGTIIFTIGGFGPTIAALTVLEFKLTFKSIINFIFSHKKKAILYLLLFCILEAGVIGLSSMELNSDIQLYMIPIIFLQAVLITGGNEELGWRGIMQPNLERKMSFPLATIIVGIVWSCWHLPLWFIEGSSQQGFPFPVFIIYVTLQSFWLACLYKKTNSVFYCGILHALSNVLMMVFVLNVNLILIGGLILMTILSIILYYYTDTKTSN